MACPKNLTVTVNTTTSNAIVLKIFLDNYNEEANYTIMYTLAWMNFTYLCFSHTREFVNVTRIYMPQNENKLMGLAPSSMYNITVVIKNIAGQVVNNSTFAITKEAGNT